MRKYVILSFQENQQLEHWFRDPVSRRELTVNSQEFQVSRAANPNFTQPSVYFTDDEVTAQAVATQCARRQPGARVVILTPQSVMYTEVPQDLPIQTARYTEAGLMPE